MTHKHLYMIIQTTLINYLLVFLFQKMKVLLKRDGIQHNLDSRGIGANSRSVECETSTQLSPSIGIILTRFLPRNFST